MEVSLDSLPLKPVVLAMEEENGTPEHLPPELSQEEKSLALRKKTRARERRKRRRLRKKLGKSGPGKEDHGHGKGKEDHLHQDGPLDAALWGELKSHVDLSMIYVKLPLAPFFRMRQVCKDWNRLASDRQFLERTFKPPIADPFFVVRHPVNGTNHLLTCQASSWSSMPLPPVKCEVSGILIIKDSFEDSNRGSALFRVFDLHTRVFHVLPPIPTTMMIEAESDVDDVSDFMYHSMIGMTVDTTVIPYSFRIILANKEVDTRIYDSMSGAWTQKSSTFDYAHLCEPRPACVSNNDFLYIKVTGAFGTRYFELHGYHLQKDCWTGVPQLPQHDVEGFGLWRERLFMFGKIGHAISVWVIDHDHPSYPEKRWALLDFMPGYLCAWLSSGDSEPIRRRIQSIFCNENVLLYNYYAAAGGEEKAVLYNLDKKTWKRVVLPPALPGRPQHQQLLQ